MAKVSDLIKEHIPSLRNEPQLVNNLDFFTSELNKIIEIYSVKEFILITFFCFFNYFAYT